MTSSMLSEIRSDYAPAATAKTMGSRARMYLKSMLIEASRAFSAAADYEALKRRSDRDLADIGLTRSDIPGAIRDRHYG